MLNRSQVLADSSVENGASVENVEEVFTPEDKKQLIEDCKKLSDDVLTVLEHWEKGRGSLIYPLIIDSMKKIGDALMNYEERHLALAMHRLRQGVEDA